MVSSASFISSYLSGREGKLTAILALTLDTKMLPDLTLGSVASNDMARLYRKELARLADLKLTRDNIAILSNQLMSITHAVNAPVDTKRIRFLCASPRSDRPEALRKQSAQNQAERHCVSSVPLAKDESKSHEPLTSGVSFKTSGSILSYGSTPIRSPDRFVRKLTQ